MRILVTGATGFIGMPLVSAALDAGHEVAALVRPVTLRSRVADLHPKVRRYAGDLADIAALRGMFADFHPEICIHLAWYTEPGKYLEARENIDCLRVSWNFLQELAAAKTCKHVVMTGTCGEYLMGTDPLAEEDSVEPATLYASTKLLLYRTARELLRENGISLSWGRIFNLYGPGEDERRVVPAVINSLLQKRPFPTTKGEQVRDYLHVEDVARALLLLTEKRPEGAVNICSGARLPIRALMEKIGRRLGEEALLRFGEVPYRDWEPPVVVGNPRKLHALGFSPSYSLERGLEQTIAWWKERAIAKKPTSAGQ